VEVIRAMPNVSIDRCSGIIGYTRSENKTVTDLFNKLGYAFAVDESEIEKVTAFASCGIGFAAYFLNCFLKAGISFGFSAAESEKIVSNIFSNALAMSDYEKTVSAVATKGGATEEGVKYFDKKDVCKIIFDGINKAYEKML
jgi:pyrroline-5-carboxylate reductase